MPSVLSTKKLLLNQRELLLNAGVSFVEYDAINVTPVDFEIPNEAQNIIITSQNGAKAFLNNYGQSEPVEDENAETLREAQSDNMRFFIVGKKTTSLFLEKGLKVTKTAQNATELALFIAKSYKNEHFFYFCGNRRRAELPDILIENSVYLDEIIVYETTQNKQAFDQNFDGVLCFSPSGVDSFVKSSLRDSRPSGERSVKANEIKNTVFFCIGETTASAARKYTDNVVVANDTSIESVIAKAVKKLASGF